LPKRDFTQKAEGKWCYRVRANGLGGPTDWSNVECTDVDPPTPVDCPTGQYKAEYWNNRTFSGNPEVTRCERKIDYDWGGGSPVSGINQDNFSVRWTGEHNFAAGNTRFLGTADDGIKVWVDNSLLIDKWIDQGPTTYTAERNLSAGIHTVRMEYYEREWGAVARLSWAAAPGGPQSCPQYKAEYWNNRTLSGSPTVTRCESTINYDWGGGNPVSGINQDNFSVRWTGEYNFAAGNTRFTGTADDGLRVWVDNNLLIDRWIDQGPTTYTADRNLSAGNHTVKMEYYENGGGAVARLSWSAVPGTPQSCPNGQYMAEYWNNRTFSGNPSVTRCETSISYDWGGSSPVNGIGSDNFSVRWTGRHSFPAGNTRFIATADDGVRVWLDSTQIINAWRDQGPTEYAADYNVSAGLHTVKMEYYEKGGGAVAKLRWGPTSSNSGNLALNRPAEATSQESASTSPNKANDGRLDTRWSSQHSATNAEEWWSVDLGTRQAFDKVVVRWEAAYAGRHFVGWSDDGVNFLGSWYTITTPGAYVYEIGSRTARYVGVGMTQHAPCCANYSIWEVEVYRTTQATGLPGESVIPVDGAELMIPTPDGGPQSIQKTTAE
jgi:hypothetical protein